MDRPLPVLRAIGRLRHLAVAVGVLACTPPIKTFDDDTGTGPETDPPENTAPQATISRPQDGTIWPDPTSVTLTGVGTDTEDGTLPPEALAWTSSLDGALGTGNQIDVPLSTGAHTLTLTVTDSEGLTGSASVGITVTADNASPLATITEPLDGTTVLEGSTVVLSGTAVDAEDGALMGASLTWTSSVDGLLGTGTTVSWTAPTIATHTVVLTAVDSRGAEGRAAIQLVVAGVGANLPPDVTLTKPLANATYTVGQPVPLEGEAIDPEDGPILGTDLTWTSSLDGPIATGGFTSTSSLSQGTHTITLTATDGDGLSASEAVTISVNPVGNQPPVVEMTSPTNGSVHLAGDPVSLEGTATDPEDGVLTGTALAWSSSRDGALGTGSPLTVTTLSAGTHLLTLTATDSGSATGTDAAVITVLAPNQPPEVEITGPADGSSFSAGTGVAFQGSGTDPEDGTLPGASLSWSSSLDGALGTGTVNTVASLSQGNHVITLTGIDSGGRTDTDTIQVQITPGMQNLPPNAVLTGLAEAAVGVSFTVSGADSTDTDGTIVQYTFDFGDGSAPVSGTSPTATHTYTAEDDVTVTLTVEDDDGATDSATLDVSAVVVPRVPEAVLDDVFELGGGCRIVVDGQDVPHVIALHPERGQLWYASGDQGAWTVELVDGPSFGGSGFVGDALDLVLDPAGTPHVAYAFEGTVRFAERVAPDTWAREAIPDSDDRAGSTHVGIALDPTNGQRPTVSWATSTSLRIATLDTASWLLETYMPSNASRRFRGGTVGTTSGILWFAMGGPALLPWSATTGFGQFDTGSGGALWGTGRMDLATDRASRLLLTTDDGLAVRVPGTWTTDPVANRDDDEMAVAWDFVARDPVLAFRNDQDQIEIIRPDGGNRWAWTYQGPMDADGIDLAVDSAGEARACFFRSGNLVVY